MKRYSWALLLLSAIAWAQAKPPAPAAPSKPATQPAPASPAPGEANPAAVPADAPVITIAGVCQGKPATAADCKTVVTKAQFEKLIDVLGGGQQAVPPQAKRQVAQRYAQLLLIATEAENRGVENSPEAKELLYMSRLQALAQAMTRNLQQQAKPTPAELQKYYESNPNRFTELTLERIMVPIKTTGDKSNAAEMKTVADQLRQRAASGTDFKTLQAEAYQKADMQNPPETKTVVLAESIPANQQAILQLKPGEVSQVIEEPTGLYIYKLDAKRQIPLEQVKSEIEPMLTQQKMQKEMETLLQSHTPELNPQYFGAAPAPPTMGRPGTPPPAESKPPTKP